jgi:23S rRNA (adenine2030-N6)-methyltransferase
MNYRHLYHAGSFADVHKHAILTLLLGRLGEKPAPYFVLDSHAGIGRYDLASLAAQKTGEFRHGIGRLLAAERAPDSAKPYLDAVRRLNGGEGLRWYPGSPKLAAMLTRPQDRLVLMELQTEDAGTLKHEFASDNRIAVHHEDGYLGLKAFLPPKERRGLVLIDPPFEATDEFGRLVEGFATAHRRWPTGIYLLWYPIKDLPPIRRFHAALQATGIRKIMLSELLIRTPANSETLNGSGLLLVNPPWQIETAFPPLLAWLAERLAQGPGAKGAWRWLVPE